MPFYLVLTVVSLTFLRLSGCKVDDDQERIMGGESAGSGISHTLLDSSGPGLQGLGFTGSKTKN
jgi:hypothetical protein